MNTPTIAVDFDGTICHYDTWEGPGWVGDPIPGALRFLRTLKARGYDIWIFSARAVDPEGFGAIHKWLVQHGVRDIVEGITHEKQYRFWYFVDDRAIHFDGDYEAVLARLT